jgi:hypothetical protein
LSNEAFEPNYKIKNAIPPKRKYLPPSMISYDRISFKNQNNGTYSKSIAKQKILTNLNKSIDYGML